MCAMAVIPYSLDITIESSTLFQHEFEGASDLSDIQLLRLASLEIGVSQLSRFCKKLFSFLKQMRWTTDISKQES